MNPIETLSDEALFIRLRDTEHDFVERKPLAQKGDWLQAAVAFANSAPIGWPAVLFVGVDDAGVPQQKDAEKLESLAVSVAGILAHAYPSIYFDIRPLHLETGSCLAVIIPGSSNRPHFAGKSYVRVGPQTKEASEEQLSELIAQRSSIGWELLQSAGKQVTWTIRAPYLNGSVRESESEATIITCNAHFLTVRIGNQNAPLSSFPLGWLELGFDHRSKRLRVYVHIQPTTA